MTYSWDFNSWKIDDARTEDRTHLTCIDDWPSLMGEESSLKIFMVTESNFFQIFRGPGPEELFKLVIALFYWEPDHDFFISSFRPQV